MSLTSLLLALAAGPCVEAPGAPRYRTANQAAQGDSSLTIQVVDEQGLPLPGVSVTLRSPALQYELYWRTEANGAAPFSELPAGTYAAEGELEGFRSAEATGIELKAGEKVEVRLMLVTDVLTDHL